jgi:hypothetical protein
MLMEEAGIRMVRVGDFAWSRLARATTISIGWIGR